MKNKILAVAVFLISFCQFTLAGNNSKSNLRAIENKGQWNGLAEFKINLSCGSMYLQPDGFAYQFISDKDLIHLKEHQHDSKDADLKNISYHNLKVTFINGNSTCKIEGSNPFETNYNYYLGDNPDKWVGGAKAFKNVNYKSIYEGVDIDLYEQNGNLKYDFIVQPFAKVSDIKFKYQGQESIELENGNLKITTSVNHLIEKAPVAYQIIDGIRQKVKCKFNLDDNNVVSFNFPDGYDKSQELIIDPEVIFSTYSGSSGDNWGYTATYDDLGNGYSGGIAFNDNFSGYPVTPGAFQSTFAGGTYDVAISKYSPDGTNLLYATYLGGSGDDNPMSIIVNSNNQLVVLGNTSSGNFPTTAGAFDETQNGGFDLFVSIFDNNGTALLNSTFIGGSDNDGFNELRYYYGDEYRSEVVLDTFDNVYIASNTSSNNFPVTVGAFDETYNGSQDACLLKLNSDLSSLEWATFIGGNGMDQSSGVRVDGVGNIFVCGAAGSSNFPMSTGLNTSYQGGINNSGSITFLTSSDGFVAKFSPDGSNMLRSTFLRANSSAFDIAFLLELDRNDDVYVYGVTEGSYPITAGVYSNANSPQFLHKLNNNLTTTLASTTFGAGNGSFLSPTALLVDICDRISISGWGGSLSFLNSGIANEISGFPVTADAYQPTSDGEDFYLAAFEEDFSALNYATFFGGTSAGEHVDGGTSRFSQDGIVYQAVCAGCGGNSAFPTTPGVWSTTNNSANCNAALFKIEFSQNKVISRVQNLPPNDTVNSDTTFCIPYTVSFDNNSSNGEDYVWYFTNGDTLYTDQDTSVSFTFDSAGSYSVMLVANNSGDCFSVKTDTSIFNFTVNDTPSVDFQFPIGNKYCKSAQVFFDIESENVYQNIWIFGDGNTLVTNSDTAFFYTYTQSGTFYPMMISYNDSLCAWDQTDTTRHMITIFPEPIADAGNDTTIYYGDSLQLVGCCGDFYSWFPQTYLSDTSIFNPISFPEEDITYRLRVTDTLGCFAEDEITIFLTEQPYIPNPIIPNIITPNDDGINDYFLIQDILAEPYTVTIYNRWGKLVYKSQDYHSDFDGGDLSDGLYFYELSNVTESYKGWLQILR